MNTTEYKVGQDWNDKNLVIVSVSKDYVIIAPKNLRTGKPRKTNQHAYRRSDGLIISI